MGRKQPQLADKAKPSTGKEWPEWTKEGELLNNHDRSHLEDILSKRTRGELLQLAKVLRIPGSKKEALVRALCDYLRQPKEERDEGFVHSVRSTRNLTIVAVSIAILFFVAPFLIHAHFTLVL